MKTQSRQPLAVDATGLCLKRVKRDIESVPWHIVGSYDDPIKAWETWKKFFLQIADKHAPIKREEYEKSVLHGLQLKLRI
jgi:hypothetical protein